MRAQPLTDISHLHTLLDPVTFLPSDTSTIFTVEGVVTTHVSLTDAPHSLFYIQDASAGIAVFHHQGASRYMPAAGDRVRVTAPLVHFNGLLELQPRATNETHAVVHLGSGNPLPEPMAFDFGWRKDPGTIESHEGRYVVLRDVFLDRSSPTFNPAGENVTITNAATKETAVLRIDPHTDIAGQVRPESAVTIYGVVSQFDSSSPRTSGYQIVPTRFADIVAEVKAARVLFTNVLETVVRAGDLRTNSFEELVLVPGETLRIDVKVDDPEGREVRFLPGESTALEHAAWTFERESGTALAGVFRFIPTQDQRGQLFTIRLTVANPAVRTETAWTIYVPTAAEQGMVMTEIMANPTSNAEAAHYNPLRRAEPAPNIASHDEYIELVNFSSAAVDLQHWTISDEVQVRHRFTEPFALGPTNSLVIYGGPWTSYVPGLATPFMPTSVAQQFGLNNSGGDTISLRNALGRLVWRVRYGSLPSDGSLTRSNASEPFVPHTSVSGLAVSPGVRFDGEPFGAAPTAEPPKPASLQARTTGQGIALEWASVPGGRYAVVRFAELGGPGEEVFSLTADGPSTLVEIAADGAAAWFIVRSE